MKLARARVGNHITNRIRLYIFKKRNSFRYFENIKEILKKFEGVRWVEANHLTGSVLIQYSGEFLNLIEYAKKQNLFELEDDQQDQKAWVSKVFQQVDRLDEKIKFSTEGTFNLASIAGLVFLSLGGVQIYRKQYLPAASALFLYAVQFLAISKNGIERPKAKAMEV